MNKRVVYTTHLSRTRKAKHIGDLAMAFKGFLHEQHGIHHGHTFTEIKEVMRKKRIPPHLKEHISRAAQLFEEMEYRPRKPSKTELLELRKHVHHLIHAHRKEYSPSPKARPRKKGLLRRVRDAGKKAASHLPSFDHDAEYQEMKAFLRASRDIGLSDSQARKELELMGFPKQKISALLRQG